MLFRSGIPEFRLPKDVVRNTTKKISDLGVQFVTNTMIGTDITVDELFKNGFDAVFIGTGTALAKSLDIPGSNLKGIIQSNYLLRMVRLYQDGNVEKAEVPIEEGDNVVVIGAGNVAMDACRTAVRMKAKSVTVAYRKTVEFQTPPSSSNQYSLIPKLSIPFPNSCTDSPQDVSYNTVCPQ